MIMPILDVKDVDASVAFYTEKLGFKQDMLMPGPDGVNAFAFVSKDNAIFGINLAQQPTVGASVDFMVYLPEGTDIEAVYAEMQAKGITIVDELKQQYWGDKTFSMHDPDGYRVTLCITVHQADMEHVAAVMRGDVEPD